MRGLAALHVALGHMMSFSTLRVDLLGGAAMPFFYILSGYVMTRADNSSGPSGPRGPLRTPWTLSLSFRLTKTH